MQNLHKQFLYWVGMVVFAIAFSIGISYLFAWTGPTAAPPGDNVPAPINVGTPVIANQVLQTRDGPLQLNGNLSILGNLFYLPANTTVTAGQVLTALDNAGKAGWSKPTGEKYKAVSEDTDVAALAIEAMVSYVFNLAFHPSDVTGSNADGWCYRINHISGTVYSSNPVSTNMTVGSFLTIPKTNDIVSNSPPSSLTLVKSYTNGFPNNSWTCNVTNDGAHFDLVKYKYVGPVY